MDVESLISFGLEANDGALPLAAVVFDSRGSLYGTTFSGGVNDVHSFVGGTGGGNPVGGVTFDKLGNIYGATTDNNAVNVGCSGVICGHVYELSPPTVQRATRYTPRKMKGQR